MNTTSFSEQCSIAHQFGEVCEEDNDAAWPCISNPG